MPVLGHPYCICNEQVSSVKKPRKCGLASSCLDWMRNERSRGGTVAAWQSSTPTCLQHLLGFFCKLPVNTVSLISMN
ncbi:hypothetical protein T4D_14918 [Trichinella pseudospiralis]|uniref:Uncharacterized protein n=1 Tax=Trichinella pseudospiralis TaxID=6337 RepID=A0A0V1FIP7_TRIPS|nr:hypothetical protein T4D_14918 [Trichinella pseudospiralis]